MNATDAVAQLNVLDSPFITTAQAGILFGLTVGAANKTLARLANAGLVQSVRRGLWAIGGRVEPLALPPYLTAPFPSYVSLQSALYLHEMISQLPAVTYVASLDRSRRIKTRYGTFSIHRLAPELFGGFETSRAGVRLATPEKALIDLFYLSATSSRRFAALPELELPRRFRVGAARAWIRKIGSRRLRTIVTTRLAAVLAAR